MEREIRPAVRDDAAAMGRVHVRAWQAAYRSIMPDDYLSSLREDDRAAMWRRQIDSSGAARSLVAVADGAVVGFAVFGPCADARADPSTGELYAMNLDPDYWGLGLGRDLLRAATEQLVATGFGELVLWVVLENDRARRLYESAGWVADGVTRDDEVLGVTVTDMRYRRT